MALLFLTSVGGQLVMTVLIVGISIALWMRITQRRKQEQAADSHDTVPVQDAPAPAPVSESAITFAVTDSDSSDPLAADKLKHAVVILHAEKDKVLLRCSALEAQLREKEQKEKELTEALSLSTLKVVELEKHTLELQKVLRDINGEVNQFKKDTEGEKPKWTLGSKVLSILGQAQPPKPQNHDNLLNLIVAEKETENKAHNPVPTAPTPDSVVSAIAPIDDKQKAG